GRDDAAVLRNLQEPPQSRSAAAGRASPSLARALTVTFRLLRIDASHFLQQLLRMGTRDVRRLRSVAISLLRPPRRDRSIDALTQQMLKIEQQLDHVARPGVMIGEATPPAGVPPAPAESAKSSPPPGTNTHTIAKGETLTSIAKMHKVSIEELQKFNHIENDRKLQIGQTIMIPPPASTPSPTPPSPNG